MHRLLARSVAMTAGTVLTVTAFVGLSSAPASAADTTAAALLGTLTVTGENTSPYSRDDFPHWVDADGDGCDTRQEVLVAESTVPVTPQGSCPVSAGRWESSFDGAVWTAPSDVDIDHTVALSEAWDSGAHVWTAGQRRVYANDLTLDASLAAVTDEVNQAKSDRDPAQWLPPSAGAHCGYAVDWVQVKYRWNLSVDSAEQAALRSLLSGQCGATAVQTPAKAGTAAPPVVITSGLAAGQQLVGGQQLVSPSGAYRAVMQTDGNVVVYTGSRVLWQSRTSGSAGARLAMQGDGNLVIYSAANRPLWSTGTRGTARLALQDDGNLVVYRSDGRPLWNIGADRRPTPVAPTGDTLSRGRQLTAGQQLLSTDGRYRFVMQPDGNAVVYTGSRAVWFTGTGGRPGARMVLQGDGNLVVYAGSTPLWNTRTNAGARLVMQSDGNLVLYTAGSRAVWSSGGDRGVVRPPPPPPPPPPGCDASYPDFCIPPSPPDLDCPQVRGLPGFRPGFTVRAPDPHRLDGADNDGRGCESP